MRMAVKRLRMEVYQLILKFSLISITILTNYLWAVGQDCSGPLEVMLQGSNSSDSLIVQLETNGITCQSEFNGNINLIVTGGNGDYQFTWSDNAMAANYRDNLTYGIYDVTISDSQGCEDIISTSIELQTPDNTTLAMESGCGNCILNNGAADYFFNSHNNYIAAIIDDGTDNLELGDTEVCLLMTNTPGTCNSNMHLQRSWSVTPSENNPACVKLFFTQSELQALSNTVYNTNPPNALDLINNNALCLTGYSGGAENCHDYTSSITYSQTDANPLEVVLEDLALGIWSISVCTDEYATFYLEICDQALPLNLISFYGRINARNNTIYWKTEQESELSHYILKHSRDAVHWKKLKKISANNELLNDYSYVHKNPGSGISYYQLNAVEQNGQLSTADVIALQREISREEKFTPALFADEIFFEAFPTDSDFYEFIFYNEAGRVAHREKILLEAGFVRHRFDLDFLPAGAYFCQVIAIKNRVLMTHKIIKSRR